MIIDVGNVKPVGGVWGYLIRFGVSVSCLVGLGWAAWAQFR